MDIKVAIFEDNAKLRESLRQLVEHTDGMYCSGAFANANKLTRNIQDASPDVVLMDIHMPGVSGIEAVGILKEKFPAIRTIMQTVFEDNDKIFAALCAGATGYILKKAFPQKIVEAIQDTFAGGAPMTPSIADKVLRMFRYQSDRHRSELVLLSEREKEILSLLVQGRSYKAIAAECFITIDTVSTHIKHIYEKMQVRSKSEAVAKAIYQKLI